VDQRNVSQSLLNDVGEIDISDATTGVSHRCQPEVAGQRCSNGWEAVQATVGGSSCTLKPVSIEPVSPAAAKSGPRQFPSNR
jgi:hypothetical protein